MSMNHSRPPYDLETLPSVIAGTIGGLVAFALVSAALVRIFG